MSNNSWEYDDTPSSVNVSAVDITSVKKETVNTKLLSFAQSEVEFIIISSSSDDELEPE